MLSRRDLVGRMAAGTAVLLASGVARASVRPVRSEAKLPTNGGQRHSEAKRMPSIPEHHEGAVANVRFEESNASVPNPPVSGAPSAPELVETKIAPPPWSLIRPLSLGSAVGYGWHVADLTGTVDGSAVLTLENERGRTHRIHICRNDGNPQGLVYTRRFDLVVMNGGKGDLPTEESFARAVAETAHILSKNENDRRQAHVLAALMPQKERLRRFADARLR